MNIFKYYKNPCEHSLSIINLKGEKVGSEDAVAPFNG